MTTLGAILAGGQARRFGTDKALALWAGRPLIAHVAGALRSQCDAVAVCGRAWGDLPGLADRPGPGHGPLGGLAAALAHAADLGHRQVLLAPCDMPLLPADLLARLAPGPAVALDQWLLGLWPVRLGPMLEALLAAEGAPSMRRFMALADARVVDLGPLANVNQPGDLEALARPGSSR